MRFLLRMLAWTCVLAVALACLVGVAVWRELTQDLPPVTELLDYRPPAATRVYSADGTPIGEFYVQRRYPVPLAEVPDRVRLAFLAAEDTEFYSHPGIDPAGIVRAVYANLRHGEITQGASTITQQVVKQLLLTPERTFERKSKEMILALELESKLTKDEILYLYLNHIYFGAGTYGIAAASQAYFGVAPGALTLPQAALLAGLPQAPSRYDPRRHPEAALKRRRYVLDRMLTAGFITPDEHAAAVATPLELASPRPPPPEAAQWYVQHVRTLLEDEYGSAFATRGLEVHTACDLRMQEAAEEVLRDGVQSIEKRLGVRRAVRHLPPSRIDEFLERQRGTPRESTQQAVVIGVDANALHVRTAWESGVVPRGSWGGDERAASYRGGDVVAVDPTARGDDGVMRFALDPEPRLEGALVAIDPETAEVKALVGGVDHGRSVFNRAVQARRQPGSAFKPFIYATAVDHGYTETSIVEDAPISLPDGRNGYWTPKNFGNRYMGAVPLRTALIHSLNTVSVRLVLDVGVDALRDELRAFGFPSEFPRHISLALGSSEVTLLDMTRAYAVFATLGRRFDPIFVTSVTDGYGQAVDFPGTRPHFETVLNPETAYVVTDMMRGVVESGTGTAAKKLQRPAAGKTGTTNDSMDAWFMGFTPDLVSGVWVGFDAQRSLGSYTGGRAAAPIWTAFMQRALEGRPVRDFAKPDGVTLVRTDGTGGPPPRARPVRAEAVVPDAGPARPERAPSVAPVPPPTDQPLRDTAVARETLP